MSNTHSPQAGNPKKSEQHQGMMHGDTATSQSQFHTYGMLKTSDAIEFYFDGEMTHRVKMSDIKGPNPFVDPDNNYILKLNQMVGGNYLARPKNGNANDWSDKTYVDATKFADDYKGIGADGTAGTDFAGSTMYVDYVRVYEQKKQDAQSDQGDKPAAPEQPSQPAEPEKPLPTPAQPEQPAQPAQPADPTTQTPAPGTPSQPAEPENPVTPAPSPEPEQPSQPVQPAAPERPITPAAPAVPAAPVPAQPQPGHLVPAQQTPAPEQEQPAQSAPEIPAQPAQPVKPTQPIKKPSTNRLASTGMFSWYRPIVTAWNNFCDWVMSWRLIA